MLKASVMPHLAPSWCVPPSKGTRKAPALAPLLKTSQMQAVLAVFLMEMRSSQLHAASSLLTVACWLCACMDMEFLLERQC